MNILDKLARSNYAFKECRCGGFEQIKNRAVPEKDKVIYTLDDIIRFMKDHEKVGVFSSKGVYVFGNLKEGDA